MLVDDNEYLARFIVSEGWINNDKVKGEAFRPRKDHGVMKTSVTRHNGGNPSEIARRGQVFKKVKRKNPVKVHG